MENIDLEQELRELLKGDYEVVRYSPLGKKSSLKTYRITESKELEVTHKTHYRGKSVYWLKSYGLDDWSVSEI